MDTIHLSKLLYEPKLTKNARKCEHFEWKKCILGWNRQAAQGKRLNVGRIHPKKQWFSPHSAVQNTLSLPKNVKNDVLQKKANNQDVLHGGKRLKKGMVTLGHTRISSRRDISFLIMRALVRKIKKKHTSLMIKNVTCDLWWYYVNNPDYAEIRNGCCSRWCLPQKSYFWLWSLKTFVSPQSPWSRRFLGLVTPCRLSSSYTVDVAYPASVPTEKICSQVRANFWSLYRPEKGTPIDKRQPKQAWQ